MNILNKVLNWFTQPTKQRKPHTKITPQIIKEIHKYKEQNWAQADIALLLNISASSVSRIINNKYKKVKNETPTNMEKQTIS